MFHIDIIWKTVLSVQDTWLLKSDPKPEILVFYIKFYSYLKNVSMLSNMMSNAKDSSRGFVRVQIEILLF